MSEWGNPFSLGNQMGSPAAEFIGRLERTQETETSQYLEERKSTETPQVAASERGLAHGLEPYVVASPVERPGKGDHRR